MSSESQFNNDNQEIDLSQISKKIGGFFENIATSVFKAILFLKRNRIVIGILFITGIVLGTYLDRNSKSYDSSIIVTPNFGANDYLYQKINLINSKVMENDTLFLKNTVGIKNPKKFGKIEVNPINDVYKFIDNNEENYKLIELMAQDGDIKKIINDKVTSKNYPYHLISFSTYEKTSQENTVQPILDFLNNSDYFDKTKKEFVQNVQLKIVANDTIIMQIDEILNSFSKKVNSSGTNDKLIYYNESTQLNEIIKTKNDLINEQGTYRIQLISLDKVIKEVSSTLNIKNNESVNGKLKLVLPFLFIFIFIVLGAIKAFYKRQLLKSKL